MAGRSGAGVLPLLGEPTAAGTRGRPRCGPTDGGAARTRRPGDDSLHRRAMDLPVPPPLYAGHATLPYMGTKLTAPRDWSRLADNRGRTSIYYARLNAVERRNGLRYIRILSVIRIFFLF